MNLRQMEVFRAVMQTGGVGGAAELLHVSQPAVSKILTQAQRQLGFRLFERVKGRLVPTPEAQTLIAEIDSLWRGVEHIRDVSRELASPRSGTLNLAISASLAPYLVFRALASLADRFPGLLSKTEILVSPILVESLLDRTADLGVAMFPNEHPNLVRVRNYQCSLAFVAPQGHRLSRKRLVTPSDLKGERVIGSPADTPYGQALMRSYGGEAEELTIHSRVRSATTACWQAQAGGGVAVVDRAAVSGATFNGLVVRPFQCRERIPVSILRNRYRPLSLIQEAFCEEFDAVWKREMRD